jgi:hypothetical protein
VASAVIYTPVANLTALAALTPVNGDYFELTDSTGAESSALITGVTVGLVGAPGLTFRLRFDSPPGIYTFLGYFANDSETRYLKFSGGTLTGQLRGDDSASAATPGFAFDGDPNTGVGRPGADELALITGGTNRLTIDSAGAVAIPGTLGVTGAITGSLTGAASSNVLKAGDTMTGNLTAPAFIPNGSTVPTNGLYLPSANNVAISTNGTGRLFVDSTGNIGVGSASNVYAGLTTLTVGNATGSVIDWNIAGTRTGTVAVTASSMVVGSAASVPVVFQSANSERMRLDTSGRLGLGTSSPSHKLVVSQNNSGGVAAIHLPEDESTILGSTANTNIKMGGNLTLSAGSVWMANTNGSERLRITSAGNVGIGTTSNDGMVHVKGAGTHGSLILEAGGTSGSTNQMFIQGHNNAGTSIGEINFAETATNQGALLFYTNGGSLTEKARLTSDGKLLVGTSSSVGSNALSQISGVGSGARAKLELFHWEAGGGASQLIFSQSRGGSFGSYTAVNSGDELGGLFFQGSNGSAFGTGARIDAVADAAWGSSDHPARLVFSTTADGASSPTERVRITNDGKALFGGTTSTSAKWNFWDTDSTGMAWLSATSSGNFRRAYLWGSAGSQGLYFNNGSNEAYLTSAGAWTNASDARIKKDIETIPYGLAEVMASQPRKYRMIADDQQCIGFVAQEMREVVPEVVSGGETEDRQYCLDYGSLVAVAFKAIQEQQAMIAELQAEVAALKGA